MVDPMMSIPSATPRFILAVATFCLAENPIVQTNFTADPAPMVFDDTVYLLTSHDDDDATGFTMYNYLLYSTADMANWTDHGIVAGDTDPNKTWAWSGSGNAWAPQAIARNNKVYLYAPVPYNNDWGIAVAVADRPEGPYADPIGKPVVTGSYDPTVFIDDDGQAYLYWGGNGPSYGVKLNSDMVSTNGDIQTFSGIPTYTEGPWLWKENSHYYLAFASHCCPEGIGYAMSDSPMGPWTFKADIMDGNPGSSGNHPGILDYKGKHYVFGFNYALTNSLDTVHRERRSVCVAEMQYNADGTIQKVPWWGGGFPSSDGVAQVGHLNPYVKTPAATIDWEVGVKTESNNEGGMAVSFIKDGSYIKVKGVDFDSAGAESFEVRASSGNSGGNVELHLDKVDGQLVGTCAIAGTGSWQTWTTTSCNVSGATGIHDLFLVFKGGSDYLFNLGWWQFHATTTGVIARVRNPGGPIRWSRDVLLLPETESGNLQVVDAHGRSRVVVVTGGKADIGPLPSGLYHAHFIGGKASDSKTFLVLP
jgi:arabinoxylan arabinofuranohydrolase